MRKAIAILLLLTAGVGTALAQKAGSYEYKGLSNFPVSKETGKVTYEGVIEAEGRSAQELYSDALAWVNEHYTGGNAIKEQQPGQFISGRGAVQTADNTVTRYDFLLQFKEGRYRYVLNNFVVLWSSGSSPLESFYPAQIKNGKAAIAQDRNMQAMHAVFDAEAAKLADIAKKKEDW